MDKDTEILDRLHNVFYRSLTKDCDEFRKNNKGEFSEGYIQCMETTAKWVLGFIDNERSK